MMIILIYYLNLSDTCLHKINKNRSCFSEKTLEANLRIVVSNITLVYFTKICKPIIISIKKCYDLICMTFSIDNYMSWQIHVFIIFIIIIYIFSEV